MTSASLNRPRLSHGDTMDRVYRYQRYIYDATRKYYLFGRDGLLADLGLEDGGTVLEVGCGTGRNLVAAAKRYPRARLHGIDISREMLESAAAAARRARVNDRVYTARGDAERFDAGTKFGVRRFDRIVFSYTLSMIPGWKRALAMGIAHMGPDASLHIVDFGLMERWPDFLRRGMQRWLAAFHVTPRAGLIGEAQRLARANGLAMKTTQIAGGYATSIVLSRPGRTSGRDAGRP